MVIHVQYYRSIDKIEVEIGSGEAFSTFFMTPLEAELLTKEIMKKVAAARARALAIESHAARSVY